MKETTIYAIRLSLSFIRDCVFPVIILILNILNVIFLKKSLIFKRKVLSIQASKVKKLEQTEKTYAYIVISTSIFTILGHFPTFVFYILDQKKDLRINDCFLAVEQFLFNLSHSINFFFYFIFEKNFYLYFKTRFNRLIKSVYFKSRISST